MARRNISLPDDLDERARRAQLNVSALAQQAVTDELDRRSRMERVDAWLDELDALHGAPSAKAMAEAAAWAASAKHVATRARRTGRGASASRQSGKARRAAG